MAENNKAAVRTIALEIAAAVFKLLLPGLGRKAPADMLILRTVLLSGLLAHLSQKNRFAQAPAVPDLCAVFWRRSPFMVRVG